MVVLNLGDGADVKVGNPVAGPEPESPEKWNGPGGTRTRTVAILNRVPLPIGLPGRRGSGIVVRFDHAASPEPV